MNDNNRQRGFAGLSDLASEISEPMNSRANHHTRHSTTTGIPREPQKTISRRRLTFRISWIIAPLLLIIYFLGLQFLDDPIKKSNSPIRSQGSQYQQKPLEYSKPPVGTNRNLSMAQIRWCVRESIRIDAMRNIVSTNNGIDKFNQIVRDYNRRCSRYQYRHGFLQRAKQEVEIHRKQIVSEAIQKIRQFDY